MNRVREDALVVTRCEFCGRGRPWLEASSLGWLAGTWQTQWMFRVASESLAMDSCGARQSDVRDKRAGVSPRREQDCAKSWQEQ